MSICLSVHLVTIIMVDIGLVIISLQTVLFVSTLQLERWSGIFRPHTMKFGTMICQPRLTWLTLRSTGKKIKGLAQVSKQGFVYVLDRVTGHVVWPIEERPVPASNVPGERVAATQPFPTRPAAFEVQGVNEEDLIDFTQSFVKKH